MNLLINLFLADPCTSEEEVEEDQEEVDDLTHENPTEGTFNIITYCQNNT